MLTEQFYDLLDQELQAIIAENQQYMQTKKLTQPEQQKSHALLIWFLQFYSPNKVRYQNVITEGYDDSSCDIIFSTQNDTEEIFYVIQAKWNKKPQIKSNQQEPKIDADEVKKAIVDFQSVLQSEKKAGKNERFNEKLAELQAHLKKDNGKVKFIFLGLLGHNEALTEPLANFEKRYAENIKLEIIDIDRLKRDYIEFRYKEIKAKNPLQYEYYQPETSRITIPIERIPDALGKGDHLKISRPYEAYIFIVKPKTIYDLFEKYEFSLFFSNIRNPLPQSNYNAAIVDTLKNKPDMFWYFNNGITAISNLIYPFGVHSEQIAVSGLQIINGAQTVYSIYAAYKAANGEQREIINGNTNITFRILVSANKEMNLQITRYTNAQNPVEERDFWANEPVQICLQEESFRTKYWYEKRRGEFRNVPKGVKVLENGELGWLFWELENPLLNKNTFRRNEKDNIFISENNNNKGLYETIFQHKNMNFEMLLSTYLLREIYTKYLNANADLGGYYESFNALHFALSKVAIEKYIKLKHGNEVNINRMLKKLCEEENEILIKLFIFAESLFSMPLFDNSDKEYLSVKKAFESMPFSIEEIEKIDISTYHRPSS